MAIKIGLQFIIIMRKDEEGKFPTGFTGTGNVVEQNANFGLDYAKSKKFSAEEILRFSGPLTMPN